MSEKRTPSFQRELKGFKLCFLTVTLSLMASCGGTQADIEAARFLLDQCNATIEATLPNCTAASVKLTAVLAADPTNQEAATLLSSAQLGLAGLDFLSIAQTLTENTDDTYAQFRTLATDIETDIGREIDIDAFEEALPPLITALTDVTATEDNENVFFQLGILQAVDAFLRPVKIAGTDAADITATTFDDIIVDLRTNFVNADNNLVDGGVTDNDILEPVRENFCRCSLNGGLTAACLRDLMRCELNPDLEDGDADNIGIEQDYNEDATTTDADCETLLAPAGLSTCSATDTAL